MKWGVVRRGGDEGDEVGHCGVSSGDVERPVEGRLYA